MSCTQISINGFGRIGRLLFRYTYLDPALLVTHINDISSIDSAAYLMKYDSVHGTWPHTVTVDGERIVIDAELDTRREILFTQHADPATIKFGDEIRVGELGTERMQAKENV